jgi:hypothetical protein
LRDRLGLSEVRYFVVSRFPAITEDPRIVAFNQLASQRPRHLRLQLSPRRPVVFTGSPWLGIFGMQPLIRV